MVCGVGEGVETPNHLLRWYIIVLKLYSTYYLSWWTVMCAKKDLREEYEMRKVKAFLQWTFMVNFYTIVFRPLHSHQFCCKDLPIIYFMFNYKHFVHSFNLTHTKTNIHFELHLLLKKFHLTRALASHICCNKFHAEFIDI